MTDMTAKERPNICPEERTKILAIQFIASLGPNKGLQEAFIKHLYQAEVAAREAALKEFCAAIKENYGPSLSDDIIGHVRAVAESKKL